MSHGTVREQFGWEDMCDVELPVPSIEKQREIVREYNVVTDRISLNEQLTQKLEDTAQGIYKQWFVHFEFPLPKEYADSIGKPELEGKPYKFCGGEMIFNGKMDSELPVIFNAIAIYDIADFVNGGAFKGAVFNDSSEGLPIIKIAELKQGVNSKTRFTNSVIDSKYFIDNDDILYSWSGNPETSLEVFKWFGGEAWLNQHIFKVNTESLEKKIFLYYLLRELKPVFISLAQGKQTTGLGHVTVTDMKKLYIPSCNDEVLSLFSESTSALYHYHSVCIKQRKALFKLLEIISIKMS
jgi:type I restriction enzyme S subunit